MDDNILIWFRQNSSKLDGPTSNIQIKGPEVCILTWGEQFKRRESILLDKEKQIHQDVSSLSSIHLRNKAFFEVDQFLQSQRVRFELLEVAGLDF